MSQIGQPDTATPSSAPKETAAEDLRRERIAIAAYYKARLRGFQPDRELDDRLGAEREIDSSASTVPNVGNSLADDRGDIPAGAQAPNATVRRPIAEAGAG